MSTTSEDVQNTAASSMSNCTPTYQDAGTLAETSSKSIANALDSMDIKSCSYQKSSGAVGGCSVYIGGCAAAAYSEQSAVGCESINVVSNMMNQVTSQLSCSLNQSSASLSATASNIQEISFKAGDITGSNITLSNKSSLKTNFVNLSQQETQKEIANTITQGIQDTVSQAQATSNEAFSDPTSQKQSAQICNDIQSVASNTDVLSNVANTALNIQGDQKIDIEVGNITDSSISITNDNVFDLVAQNFAYNAIAEVVGNTTVQQTVASMEQTQTQANKGALSAISGAMLQSLIGGIIFMVVIGVLWYFLTKKKPKPQKVIQPRSSSPSFASNGPNPQPPSSYFPSFFPSMPSMPSMSSMMPSMPSFFGGYPSTPRPPPNMVNQPPTGNYPSLLSISPSTTGPPTAVGPPSAMTGVPTGAVSFNNPVL
ncbi:MAG: hypothetical protein EBR74_11190 [Flavobacteriia bacterium]|nr:hypothetical protein [Flavobacteriia bacterium]